MIQLQLNSDRSEQIPYNFPGLTFHMHQALLSQYPDYAAASHWHDDVELILVDSGKMTYNVNGRLIRMQAGEGIFVNTRQLHYGFSEDHSDCHFLCLVFHPLLLCVSESIECRYVRPVLENDGVPWLFLSPDSPREASILETLGRLPNDLASNTSELAVLQELYHLWPPLFELAGKPAQTPAPRDHHLSSLKDMTAFLSAHYQEKLSLGQISAAGNVSKSTCCAIFQRYLNQTPLACLTRYRLQRSVELLLQTNLSISEIAWESGFSGASYFTETFRKAYGRTPSDYRKTARGRDENISPSNIPTHK